MKNTKQIKMMGTAVLLAGFVCCMNAPTALAEETATQTVVDSLGREVEIPDPCTSAIVSNAYNMEIVNAINAIDQVAGVDWYIWQDEEAWGSYFDESYLVGSDSAELDYELVVDKNPDVIVCTGNCTGNYEDVIKAMEPFGIPVVVSNAYYTAEFFDTVDLLGQVFGKEEDAAELTGYFSDKLDYINTQLDGVEEKSVYFEYRTEGRTTIEGDYFYNMVEFAHADNLFGDSEGNTVELEAVVDADPEYIVKVSQPDVTSSYIPPTEEDMEWVYNDLVSRAGWDEITAVKEDNILLLSHYVHGGASKLVGTMYIAKFMYPDLLPDLNPEEVFAKWLEFQHRDYIEGHTRPAYTLDE